MPSAPRGDDEILQALHLPEGADAAEIRAARDALDRLLRERAEEGAPDASPTPAAAAESGTVADGDTYVDVAELDEEPVAVASARAEGETVGEAVPKAPRATRRGRRSRASRAPEARPAATKSPSTVTPLRRRVTLGVMALLVPGIVWGVYAAGAPATQMPANHPNVGASPTPQAQPTFDQAKADQLKARITADPNDIEARRSLATMHFKVEQFTEAAAVLGELLERRPQDFDARLVRGVALFNTGDYPGAEKEWTLAAQQDPKSPDPHYNLGFLHMSTNPPDMAKVEAEWRTVVELAPDSELAKTVSSHMERINGAPSAAPTKK